jgi:acyl-CoA reductase-like NAD-dependent aldehyde dehydrogenase
VSAVAGPAQPATTRHLESHDPADGTVVATFAVDDEASVRAAVTAARRAAPVWRDLGPGARSARLRAWRRELWRDSAGLAGLVHRETGKPADDALIELALTLEHLRWAERNAARVLRGRRISPGLLLANFAGDVRYEPLGVVGVIGPWNYPLYAPNSAACAALAAGNTVVLKPSEHTPAVAAAYVAAFRRANPDLPDGVLAAVYGAAATGQALCDAGTDKISFTGSTATGSQVMARCARNLTPVVLECGGKDAAIVAGDADPVAAARAVAWGAFTNGGQTCVGVERAYVVRDVAGAFLAELERQVSRIRPGTHRNATYGPMTMPGQAEVVRRHVTEALRTGATTLGSPPLPDGARLVHPVVLLDAPEDCSAVREETFGPTLAVRVVDDTDDAVRLANDSPYGLSAAVFSRSRGREIADRLDVGQVCVNSVIAFAGMGAAPMGGVRGSGFGRLHGEDGIREFARPRTSVTKRFAVPGLELVTLDRSRHLVPILRAVLSVRHGPGPRTGSRPRRSPTDEANPTNATNATTDRATAVGGPA